MRILAAVMMFLSLAQISIAQEKRSIASQVIDTLGFPELEWKIPEVGKEVTRTVLPNGLILYLMENHELPLISAHVLVRAASIYEPLENMAVAGITGTVMRTGGTKSFTPDSLNTLLEFIAGSVESSIGLESGSASMSVMSRDIDIGLKILSEILRYPAFDTVKINLEKSQIKESIRRRNDRPGSIAGREFVHLLYGDHPYGRILEWEFVKDVGRDDLIRYHQDYYHPNSTMIAISGDFNTKAMIKKFEKAFGDWQKTETQLPPIPDVDFKTNPGVFLIDKKITQTNIIAGHLGVKRDNPDKYAISLMNFTLGGGSFTSRLISRVRSDEGLAYSVRSSFSTGDRDYGTFQASAQTKTPSTHRVLEIFSEEIARMQNELPSNAEFETARDAYINNFVFQFDSPDEVVDRLMGLEYDGYPPDYYQKYLSNVRAVTLLDIKRVAEKYLKPGEMTILVLADTSQISGNLGDFGQVHHITLKDSGLE